MVKRISNANRPDEGGSNHRTAPFPDEPNERAKKKRCDPNLYGHLFPQTG